MFRKDRSCDRNGVYAQNRVYHSKASERDQGATMAGHPRYLCVDSLPPI